MKIVFVLSDTGLWTKIMERELTPKDIIPKVGDFIQFMLGEDQFEFEVTYIAYLYGQFDNPLPIGIEIGAKANMTMDDVKWD